MRACCSNVGNNFMQLLEGSADVLDALVEAIKLDTRHGSVTVILQREIERRTFPDWSMGYRRLDTGDRRLEGFRELPNKPEDFLTSAQAPSLAAKLLYGFQANNR